MYYHNPQISNLYRTDNTTSRTGYLRLDMNENPEGLPREFVNRVCEELTPEYLSMYPETKPLTEQLAGYLQIAASNICLTNGSDEAIRLIFETFTQKGGKVVTTQPTFAMYEVYCNMYGRILEPITYQEDFTIKVESVLDKIDKNTELIIMVNPDNPMGFQFSVSDMQQIIERAARFEALVMIDEAYVQFGERTFIEEVKKYDNVIILRTFSKLFSLATCRLGVAISHPTVIQLMKQAMSSYNVNGVALKFAEKILAEHLEEKLLAIQTEGKQYLLQHLQQEGYDTRAAGGNFIFLRTKTSRDYVAAELEKKKILVKSYNNDLLKDYIRVTTGSKAVMQRFIQALLAVDIISQGNQRIVGEKIEIDYHQTLEFFNGRGENKTLKNKYNYVLFQDDNPELAEERDATEKEKISEQLTWTPDQVILDLGCGIGRWGEEILRRGMYYVGIDYCEKFIKIGKNNLREFKDHMTLLHGSLQEFSTTLREGCTYHSFDKVFVNGVFMYLNDKDLEQAIHKIGTVCKEHCEIYIKETAAIEKRLTLNQIYSENLSQNYTAIYRSIKEYDQLFSSIFVEQCGFTIVTQAPLFEEGLRNRQETLDYYYILRK